MLDNKENSNMNISKAMTEKFPDQLKWKRSVLKHNSQTYSFEFFSSQEDTHLTVLSPWLQPGIEIIATVSVFLLYYL